jgi:hypothetical protein
MFKTLHLTSLALALPACLEVSDDVATDEAALAIPTVIASGQDTPLGVIADATTAYWVNAINFTADPYDIAATAKAGGQPVRVLESAIPNVGQLSQDESRLFWPVGAAEPNVGGLFSRPKASGPVTTLVANLRVFHAVPSGTVIYFISPDDGGFIGRVSKSGGPVTKLATNLGDGLDNIPILAVTRDRIVFTQSTFGVDCDGRVRSLPKSGGPVTTHASDICHLFYLGADTLFAFWTESNAETGVGRLMRLWLGGPAAPIELDTVAGQATFLATDLIAVYYQAALDDGTTALRRVTKFGDTAATIATDDTLAFSLALDDAFAYWTSPFTGDVKRVRRQPPK